MRRSISMNRRHFAELNKHSTLLHMNRPPRCQDALLLCVKSRQPFYHTVESIQSFSTGVPLWAPLGSLRRSPNSLDWWEVDFPSAYPIPSTPSCVHCRPLLICPNSISRLDSPMHMTRQMCYGAQKKLFENNWLELQKWFWSLKNYWHIANSTYIYKMYEHYQ